MSNARANILGRLAAQTNHNAVLPDLDQAWITYEDPAAQFEEVLAMVGGTLIHAASREEAARQIASLPVVQSATTIVSSDSELLAGNLFETSIDDPHELASVDLALCPAEFWVAENGAVWVTQRACRHRVLLFLTQHLILTVPRANAVHNMHEAYRRIAGFQDAFGVFVSGPSKTADIEQSLVIGAHGARSLHLVMIG